MPVSTATLFKWLPLKKTACLFDKFKVVETDTNSENEENDGSGEENFTKLSYLAFTLGPPPQLSEKYNKNT